MSAHNQKCTGDTYHHVSEVSDESHQRRHDAAEELCSPGGITELHVRLMEAFMLLLFCIVCFHGIVTGVDLLHLSVQFTKNRVHQCEVFLGTFHDVDHDDESQTCSTQSYECHDPVRDEHDEHDAKELCSGMEQVADALVQRHTDRIDIVNNTGKDITDQGIIKIPERQLIDLLTDVFSQSVRSTLCYNVHQPHLQERECPCTGIEACQHDTDLCNSIQVDITRKSGCDKVCNLGNIFWSDDGQDRSQHGEEDCKE